MPQHRVYYTDTQHGYILCDSKDHANEIKQFIEDGLPLEDLASGDDIIVIESRRHGVIKSLPD